MKQEALAQALGISQQSVSNLENSEDIDDVRLKGIAEALGVSLEAIRNFSEENVINYFNIFSDNSVNNGHVGSTNNQCTFNPLDKIVELYDGLCRRRRIRLSIWKNS